jgi:hypothetical protein
MLALILTFPRLQTAPAGLTKFLLTLQADFLLPCTMTIFIPGVEGQKRKLAGKPRGNPGNG